MAQERKIICILCPNCCELDVSYEGKEILSIENDRCPRGLEYASEELFNPARTLITTVPIKSRNWKTVSVRTTKPVPKSRIFDVYDEVKKIRLRAPINRGDIIIENVLGFGADVIATRTVKE
ncbi:DUF1667 domain-containing protein [bacterium]|nr:DUF1667 domain-containing protein [bacterium]